MSPYTDEELLHFMRTTKPGSYITANELKYGFGSTSQYHAGRLRKLAKAGKLKKLSGKTKGGGAMYELLRENPDQELFMPDKKLRDTISLYPERDLEPAPDTLVVVQHKSTPKWLDLFMEEGIDATITPPDTNLGRLTINKKTGTVTKSRIADAGLFVGPALGQENAIIIVVPAKDVKLSLEAEGLGYKTGLQGLYGAGDAILQRVIDPSEIAGRLIYRGGWTFIPNPQSLFADRFEANYDGSLLLIEP